MAIYRPRQSRMPLLIGALVLGLAAGFAIGAAVFGGRPASVEDAAARVRASLDGAASFLEIAELEYDEATDGAAIANPVEYRGSLDALGASRDRYAEVEPALTALDADRAAAVSAAYAALEALMRRPAPIEEVRPALVDLEALLRGRGAAEASP